MKKILLILVVCSLSLNPIFTNEIKATSNGKKICIDPGHQKKWNNGKEPIAPGSKMTKTKVSSGTQGVFTSIPEYVFTLDIGLKLEKELKKRGYNVFLTRSNHDVNLSNIDRAKFCNSVKADLTIRIHADGSTNKKTNGIHILYPEGSYTKAINKQSKEAAIKILEELIKSTGAKKASTDGLSPRSDITGFNWAKYPVVLPELGYMSNVKEDKKLATPAYREKLVLGISNGVDKYFDLNIAANQKYFKANKHLPIYDNRSGELIEVGKVYKGQTYPIISSSNYWYKVKFANYNGYIRKSNTRLVTNHNLRNLNVKLKPSSNKFVTIKGTAVKDNSSGKLVSFVTLQKGIEYPIIKEYSKWYQIEILGRIGYVAKLDTQKLSGGK
ncbi:N-acetylmuramoyl-L-alanine amidase [Metabacillus litoralis]|uniref:N-acetylmuramoyl-L-alanine amidase n=1 Tax=Metabacillus litoralis TaxID=152268 RepID=A0A5C6W0T3_9BACI|nr:N-acetylmuramoyl-L-alanine amidase [Metabacillus litoralis]TXC90946.1 N-acetylmuramoyl-L-alanine amidase [Metabacillus litoralis]